MTTPSTLQHRLDADDEDEDGDRFDARAGSDILGVPMTTTGSMLNQGAMATSGSRTTPGSMIAQVTWKQRFDGFDGYEDGAGFDEHAGHPATSPRWVRRGRGRRWVRRPRRSPGSSASTGSMGTRMAPGSMRRPGTMTAQVTWKLRLDAHDEDGDGFDDRAGHLEAAPRRVRWGRGRRRVR
jgi:hypothetical protein